MNTKTTLPFADTICADVRKIIDAIFKDTPVAFDLFQYWDLLVSGEYDSYDSRMNIIHTVIASIRQLSKSDMHLVLVESRNGVFDRYRGTENIEILDTPEK